MRSNERLGDGSRTTTIDAKALTVLDFSQLPDGKTTSSSSWAEKDL